MKLWLGDNPVEAINRLFPAPLPKSRQSAMPPALTVSLIVDILTLTETQWAWLGEMRRRMREQE